MHILRNNNLWQQEGNHISNNEFFTPYQKIPRGKIYRQVCFWEKRLFQLRAHCLNISSTHSRIIMWWQSLLNIKVGGGVLIQAKRLYFLSTYIPGKVCPVETFTKLRPENVSKDSHLLSVHLPLTGKWFWIARKAKCLHEPLQVPDVKKTLQDEIGPENYKTNEVKFDITNNRNLIQC